MTEPAPTESALRGWDWLGASAGAAGDAVLERAFATSLNSSAGQHALAHLRRVFLDRRLPPSATDAELRHAEGQRSVVAYIVAMADRGGR